MSRFGRIPGVKSIEKDPPLICKSEHNKHLAKSIVIDSSVRDSGSTPTTRIRPGATLGLVTSTGRYVEATSALADKKTKATTTSKIAIAAWNTGTKTFKWKYKGGKEETVSGATADTAAQMITSLNADANFRKDLFAEAGAVANTVKISANRAGPDEWFEITGGTVNSQGGVADDTFTSNTQYAGTNPDIVVLTDDQFVDLIDVNGTATHATARGQPSGDFNESNLRHLDAHAKHVLLQNGSFFR